MNSPKPRPGILDIAPYVAGTSSIKGQTEVIKLSSNEGAFGPSPKAVKALQEMAASAHRYPDGNSANVRQAIAEIYNLNAEQIVCGAGSDELISLLCQAYGGPGDEILYSRHGFLMYEISARAVGATPVSAPETNLTADVDHVLSCVTDKTRILFLANPNNPTGTYLSHSEMHRLRKNLRSDIILVIDAAYAEFVERNDYQAGADLVDLGDNTVMTRTFSKIYALGGLRLGWAYCPPSICGILNRIRGPFNVGSQAMICGEAAVNDLAFTKKCKDHNDTWLTWTAVELRKLGLFVPENSVGNFVLVRFPETPGKTAADADAFLQNHNIIIRRLEGYGLADCLRITIGLEHEMRAVIKNLRLFMGKNS